MYAPPLEEAPTPPVSLVSPNPSAAGTELHFGTPGNASPAAAARPSSLAQTGSPRPSLAHTGSPRPALAQSEPVGADAPPLELRPTCSPRSLSRSSSPSRQAGAGRSDRSCACM